MQPPLGILYLSSWLRKHGHNVSIVDLAGVDVWRTHCLNEYDKLVNADIIAFTATTPQAQISQKIRDFLKKGSEFKHKKYVIGGIHYTSLVYANEMDFLEKDGFDSYCIGEGYNAVTKMAEDFPNLKRMYAEPILKDVNELPFAARDLIDIKSYKYKLGDVPTTTYYTQYGCYYECTYCVHPDSHIITSEGLKKIIDVKVGDLVLTHKGRFKPVLKTFQHEYDGDLITVKTKGGSDEELQTTTTIEHEYFTRHLGYGTTYNNPNGRMLTYFAKTRADNLKTSKIHNASEYIIFPRIKEIKDLEEIFTPVEFFNVTTVVSYPVNYELMKVIGYYLAEGSIKHNIKRGTHGVVFSFGKSQKEEQYAMELIDALNKLGIKSLLGNYSGWRVSVDSVKFARFIENNFGRYSFKKHIPLWMKLLPPEKLDVMFNCYINGDGHRYKKIIKFQRIVARTVSKQLALDMRDISLKLGYTCGIVTHTNKPVVQGRNVNIHKTYVCAFTPSERNCIRNDKDYVYLAIKEITRKPYKGLVYDLEVEEDHSFCTPLHCISNCESKMAGSYTVRAMTPQRIQDEIRHVRDTYGIRGVMVFDDEMNLDKKRLLGICEKIKELGDIVWRGFMVTSKFDDEIARACKASNCWEVASGIESGSPKILRTIKKPATVEMNRKFLITAKKAGLRTKAFMIIGLPNEDWKTLRETYDFLMDLKKQGYAPDDVDFSILQVYKGSGIYQNPLDIKYDDYDESKMYYKSSPDSYTDLIQIRTKELDKYDLVAVRNLFEMTFKKKGWIKDYTDRKDLDEVYKQDRIQESISYAKRKLQIQD